MIIIYFVVDNLQLIKIIKRNNQNGKVHKTHPQIHSMNKCRYEGVWSIAFVPGIESDGNATMYVVHCSYKYRCPFLYWMLNYLHSTDAIQSVVMQLSGTSKQVWRSLLRDPIPWQWAQAVVKLALPRVRGYLSLPLIRPHFIHIWKLWYCGSAPPKAWCRLSINSCASFPRIPGLFDAHGIQLAQSWTVSQIPLIARTCERSIANSQ